MKIKKKESIIFDWFWEDKNFLTLLFKSRASIIFCFDKPGTSNDLLKISNFALLVGPIITCSKIAFRRFRKRNSNDATKRAPITKKYKVPSRPKVIYLLKIWIIKIGLNNPMKVIKSERTKTIPRELLFFNISSQYSIFLTTLL